MLICQKLCEVRKVHLFKTWINNRYSNYQLILSFLVAIAEKETWMCNFVWYKEIDLFSRNKNFSPNFSHLEKTKKGHRGVIKACATRVTCVPSSTISRLPEPGRLARGWVRCWAWVWNLRLTKTLIKINDILRQYFLKIKMNAKKISDEESIRLLNKDRIRQDTHEVEAVEATLYKRRVRSYFFLSFWPCHEACGIPVPPPRMESIPSAVKA